MSDDEIQAVMWNKAKDIAKSLGLRNDRRPSYSACLKNPIESEVWRFLSLKMNTFEERKAMNLIDKPSIDAAKLLQSSTSTKLSEYYNFDLSHGHEASIRFIKLEKHLLENINSGLNELIRDLSFTDSSSSSSSSAGGKSSQDSSSSSSDSEL